MAELKRNFTRGRMNRDLDERMVPNGEYRSALNVEVATSEGSNVGTIQTLKGNTSITSLFEEGATCVGNIVDENNNKLYWLVSNPTKNEDASTTYSHLEQDDSGTVSVTNDVYSDYIIEYDEVNDETNYIVVEHYKVITKISNDSHGGNYGADHIHVSNLGSPGDIRPVGIQVGMEVTVNGLKTFVTKIEDDSSVTWNGWRVYTKHTDSDNGYAGLLNVTAGMSVTFELPYKKRLLAFSHFASEKPKKLITGINILDNLLFWTDGLTEPKKINIDRCKYGSQQALPATYPNGTNLFNTLLVVNGQLPNSTTNARIGGYNSNISYLPLTYREATVIKKSPTSPLTLTMSNTERTDLSPVDGSVVVSSDIQLPTNTSGTSDFFFYGPYKLEIGDVTPSLTFPVALDWEVGDTIEFSPNDDDAGFNQEPLAIVTVASVSNGNTTFTFTIVMLADNLQKVFINFRAALQREDPLFEFKFPRFAYRWRYEDGEYSCFSPFSDIAFLPDEFDYFPKKGYNLGMTNNLRYLLLSGFKPKTTPLDVVEIDVLYKESNSPNIYTVETIKSPSSRIESLGTSDFDGDISWFGKIKYQGAEWESPNTLTEHLHLVTQTSPPTAINPGTFYSYRLDPGYGELDIMIGDQVDVSGVGTVGTINSINYVTNSTTGDLETWITIEDTGGSPVNVNFTGNFYFYRRIARKPAIYLDDPQGSLEVETDMIHATLPANQLLRPWDNVPRIALAQEVTGNRVVYGNYIQNYDLKEGDTGEIVKPRFGVELSPRKNIRDNVRYDNRSALKHPDTGVAIDWWDPLNNIEKIARMPERSIKSIRDYQIGVVFQDEYGRQTPVQTHPTGKIKIAKLQADQYNSISVRVEDDNLYPVYPEWATHFKYYVKENSNEYYNLAMDRFYNAEDGNVWLSFPSSERNKVDEETFLILKKQHDTDVFVDEDARYKILAIDNEAPDFVKTRYETKGIASGFTFGGTFPAYQNQQMDIPSGLWSSVFSGVATPDLAVRVSDTQNISRWYDVTSIVVYGSYKRIRVDTNFGVDMAFTTDDGLNTGALNSGLSVEFAKKIVKNLPEFDGRFFVKIYRDAVVEDNILAFSEEKVYIPTESLKLYYGRRASTEDSTFQNGCEECQHFWAPGLGNNPNGPFLSCNHGHGFVDNIAGTGTHECCGPGYWRDGQGLHGGGKKIDISFQSMDPDGGGGPSGWNIRKHEDGTPSLRRVSLLLETVGVLFRWRGDTTVYRITAKRRTAVENYTGNEGGSGYDNASNHRSKYTISFEPKLGSTDGMPHPVTGDPTGKDAVGKPCSGYDPFTENAEIVGADEPPTAQEWHYSTTNTSSAYHRRIEFLEEFIPNSSYSSDNPAIWETEPKEDIDVDIYNEMSPAFPIKHEWNPYLNRFEWNSDYGSWRPLNYYNCFSFHNGVESNRIRDDFNAVMIDKGPKVSTVLAEQYKEEERRSGLIYSGIYNSISGINRLNQFIQAEKITKDLNPTYGSIQKLWSKDTDLVALCEDRIIKVLANKDALYNADGNSNVTATAKVLGAATPFQGDYGISTDPESFAIDQYRAYFTDKSRGAVMRISQQGLTPISDLGMRDYFKDALQAGNINLIGSYDDNKKLYNLTIAGGQGDDGYEDFVVWQSGQVSLWNGLPTQGNPLGNWTTEGLSDNPKVWDAYHQTGGTFTSSDAGAQANLDFFLFVVNPATGVPWAATPVDWTIYDSATPPASGTAGWGGIGCCSAYINPFGSLTGTLVNNQSAYPLVPGNFGANIGTTIGSTVKLWFSKWTSGYPGWGHPRYDTTQNWNDLITQLNINGPGNVYLYMNGNPTFVWDPYQLDFATGLLANPWAGDPAAYFAGVGQSASQPNPIHQPEACFAIQSIDYNATRKSYEVEVIWLVGLAFTGDSSHFVWSLEGPFADDDTNNDPYSNGSSDDDVGIVDITVSFSEDSSGWTSFKSWLQESGASLNDKYFSFNGAELYQHHDNETRNEFYGLEYDSTVCVIFNDMPSSVKSFAALSYEGSQSRVVANTDDGEYYNNANIRGWYASFITTDLETGFVPEFRNKEGKWFNYIRENKSNTLANLDVRQFSTQGIGRPSTVVTTQDPRVDEYTLTIQDTGDTD